jgi:PBP1b-binding outer membrane lipoprotein LpoB
MVRRGSPVRVRRWALSVRVVTGILAAALLTSGCSVESDSEKSAPPASETTVSEFQDLSLPKQSDVVERYYEQNAPQRCSNVQLRAGPSSEFMDRIRTRARGADDGDPVSRVLLQFCQ